jgi:hypothetical protein
MEILTRDEFFAKNPAPGTKFLEIDEHACVIVARDIDPDTDEPDDITMIGFEKSEGPTGEDKVIVIEWGSWEGHEELLAKHDAAAASLKLAGFNHKCAIGIETKSDKTKKTGKK